MAKSNISAITAILMLIFLAITTIHAASVIQITDGNSVMTSLTDMYDTQLVNLTSGSTQEEANVRLPFHFPIFPPFASAFHTATFQIEHFTSNTARLISLIVDLVL